MASRWRRAVAGLSVVAALATVVAGCNRSDDRPEAADGEEDGARAPDPDRDRPPAGARPGPGGRTRPSSTTRPSGDPADVEATVRELEAFVEGERGLAFKKRVAVRLADPAEFRERLLRDVEEDEEEIARTEAILRALGLIEDDVDLREVVTRFIGESVVGAYFPDTDELWVRSGQGLTPYVRVTIVHELTHALQDQHFDLDRPEYDDRDDEIGFGFDALVEGDATVVEEAFLRTLSSEERRRYRREEAAIGDGIDLEGVPDVVVQTFALPYVLGPGLVEALVDEGDQARLDEAFADPPVTSEQVLHPEAYIERDTPNPVQAPPADGPVVEDGMFGELGFVLLLQEVEGVRPDRASDGWGGDHYVVWQAGGQTCIRIAAVMETPSAQSELAAALRRWQRDHPTAKVESRGGQLLLTACD